MNRAFFSDTIESFLQSSTETVLGKISASSSFDDKGLQKQAWREEITLLQKVLPGFHGSIYFEFDIPRMGKRIDVLFIIKHVVFILEFKTGESEYTKQAIDQVWDYALDLQNFHETSHNLLIAPILVKQSDKQSASLLQFSNTGDKVLEPVLTSQKILREVIDSILDFTDGEEIAILSWEDGRYHPTPTIIEAAQRLYNGHRVENITRSEGDAINLTLTSDCVDTIITTSKNNSQKSICFVTGVPGAGKTLVGLKIAMKHIDNTSETYSVFLSGNGPLVAVLREALTIDRWCSEKEEGKKTRKAEILTQVKSFIQNVHNFRDDCLRDTNPPIEHVALFDEAQRAWTMEQTTNFMSRRKGRKNFNRSEPEFLIHCLDRHKDWAVVVCLVGGGQEINQGEAGISEWLSALIEHYPDWHIYISPTLSDTEYAAGKALEKLSDRKNVTYNQNLHLGVSMRSFRAEHLSLFVKQLLDLELNNAKDTYAKIKNDYPIVITRNLTTARDWLRKRARGNERYGIVVSSQAERLRPQSIFVKSPVDPVHWFLKGKDDIRSSYYLEDVATEFVVQGLELDWVCVTWDGDFRYSPNGWKHFSFKGSKWQNINKLERQLYLKNAYRVLLTRARQGMIIFVPEGDRDDPTRSPNFYDPTFEYLQSVGIPAV